MQSGSERSLRRLSHLFVLAGAAMALPALALEPEMGAVPPVEDAFLGSHPATSFYHMDGRITTVYGRAFQGGENPLETAGTFIAQNAGLWGVGAEDIVPGSLAADGAHTRGLMFDPASGTYKFTLVSYLQTYQGIPVFQSDIRLLVRNEPGSPLVLVRSALRSVSGYRLDDGVAASPNVAAGFEKAMKTYPGIGEFSTPRVVVFAGDSDHAAQPKLAIEFEGTVGAIGGDVYEKWHVVTDAATGDVLWTESLICHTDVTGSVKGMATPGFKADTCATEVVTALPYARASIGATVAYADVNGNFTIPNSGSASVSVASGVRGKWFRVYNSASAGADPDALTLSVTPPGPANFVHNPSNNNATKLSGVNAYISANKVRDYALTYDPAFPTIASQTEFRVNINVSGTCNAFYDGSSINFYPAGGGCPSTAYGDVVYHEYGHHMVSVSGSGQGQYGEGYGDLNGVMMDDDPVLGYGFSGSCSSGIRTANNTKQYPCSGEIHDCGQLITGCFWSTRNQLVVSNPSDYRTLLSNWAVNSVQVHSGTEITPQITIDVMTLDDNDADITNGTPHYTQIQAGFSAHNMAGPIVNALSFSFPNGKPGYVSPDGGTTLDVIVTPGGSNTLNTSSGKLYIDKESDGSFVSYTMQYLGSNKFRGTFPAIPCNTSVRYYVEAKTGSGSTLQSPQGAPASYYGTVTARDFPASFSDDCETDPGWTVGRVATQGQTLGPTDWQGKWQRGTPVVSTQAPSADYDGSGQCWLTGNAAGSNPEPYVDMTLTSPTLDASSGDAFFAYARWFYADAQLPNHGTDFLRIEVSNNNGGTWTTMETLTSSTSGWEYKIHHLSDYLPLTSQMRIRFTASDDPADNLVEAAVDALSLGTLSCYCPSDFDQNGFVNGDDFDGFIAAFEAGDESADFDHNTFVNGDDFDLFVQSFETGC